jgi:hypothetical protein
MVMKFSKLTTIVLLAVGLSACEGDFDYLDEEEGEKACEFYGNCEKPKTVECSFYGNCPDKDKKDEKQGGRTNDAHSSSAGGDMGASTEHKE